MNQKQSQHTSEASSNQTDPTLDARPVTSTSSSSSTTGPRWRLRTIVIILGALGLVLSMRLFTLQVNAWQNYAPSSLGDRARYTVDDNTPWGVIVDRDGVLLAADRYTYRITATPNHIPPEEWTAIAQILWERAAIPVEQTRNRLAQNSESSYVVLATDVPFAAGRRAAR